MCVTFFCLQPKNGQKQNIEFLIGFNRDERTKRDTDPLMPFPEDPNVYAGKDKISGGTWLGVNIKTGIIVILTNYDLQVQRVGRSRGKLVFSFLKTSTYEGLSIQDYDQFIQKKLCEVLAQRQNYSAFNLLVYSIQTSSIFYICSQMNLNEPKILSKDQSYGMCNGPLEQVWQKTKHGLNKFKNVLQIISTQQNQKDYFFSQMKTILKDQFRFDEDLQKEASIFINPYFSNNQKAQRMTKCSFIGVVTRKQNNQGFQICMKQITYTSPQLQESQVSYTKKIGE